MIPQECEIISLLKKGDELALQMLFRQYHKSLYHFAFQLVNNEMQAEDAVAETFVKVWKRNSDFNCIANLRSFMYLCVKNNCINYLKHIQRREASHDQILHLAEQDENYIEAKIIKAELIGEILAEVESLPPTRRKIFKMIFFDELGVFEIAEKLGISVNTVRVQKARALQTLRSAFLKRGINLDITTLLIALSCLRAIQGDAQA